MLGSLVMAKRLGMLPSAKPAITTAAVVATPVQLTVPKPPINPLVAFSAQQHTLLSDALGNALKVFGKTTPSQQPLDCKVVERLSLACFLDRSSWQELLALNRPVVMEFALPNQQKAFALLTGLAGSDAVLLLDKEIHIPITTVLQYWNGYYLLVWKPPIPGVKELKPFTTHPAVAWLRQRLGVPAKAIKNNDHFSQSLVNAVIAFQKQHQLIANGLVDPRTFVLLQNRQLKDHKHQLALRD